MGSGAARSPQFRVAGNRGLSGLRTRVRNGDGRCHSIRCTIHVVPGLWRASGGLVGGPALAAENELAGSISIAPEGKTDLPRKPGHIRF